MRAHFQRKLILITTQRRWQQQQKQRFDDAMEFQQFWNGHLASGLERDAIDALNIEKRISQISFGRGHFLLAKTILP